MQTEIELLNIAKVKRALGKTDKKMAEFLKIAPDFNLRPSSFTSVYQALVESIISQQLSAKAANCIFRRVCNLFGSSNSIRPLDIFRAEDEELHDLGVSTPKIAAIRDLTDFEMSGRLPSIEQLNEMDNESIVQSLVKIRGVGRWTVEMLLIFKLGRADVISGNDLGLRKGFAIVERTYPTLPTSEEMLAHAEKHWKPYRSIASWYLWRACEGL